MEITRSYVVRIERDTNKATYVDEYQDPIEAVKAIMQGLSDDERRECWSSFCKHCGGDNPRCQCWNDE